eukprot:997395-Rhodomonas_salina.5
MLLPDSVLFTPDLTPKPDSVGSYALALYAYPTRCPYYCQAGTTVPPYAPPTRCPAPRRCAVLTGRRAGASGRGLPPTPICLRVAYGTSGTDVAYAAHAYVLRGKGVARAGSPEGKGVATGGGEGAMGLGYGARYWESVWCYAMCSTERAYGATRCAVLREYIVLRGVQY